MVEVQIAEQFARFSIAIIKDRGEALKAAWRFHRTLRLAFVVLVIDR